MATILVTGGGGFIGTHIVQRFIAAGHTVRVLDAFYVSPPAPALANAQLWMGDVKDTKLIQQVLEGVDVCVHLATVPSIVRPKNGHTPYEATLPIFEMLAGANIPVVYASSSSVYGNNQNIPLPETEEPAPLSPYAIDKTVCEQQARAQMQANPGWQAIGLRMFNIYGPGQSLQSPYCGLLTIACHKMRKRETLQLYGAGEQVRDFVHVADVAVAFECAVSKLLAREALPNFVYNVCSGEGVALIDAIKELERATGRTLDKEILPAKPSDILVSVGNASAAQHDLGFSTKVTLRRGIEGIAEYYFEGGRG